MEVGIYNLEVHTLCLPCLRISPAYTHLVTDDFLYLFYQIPVNGLFGISYIFQYVCRIGWAEQGSSNTWIADSILNSQLFYRIILGWTVLHWLLTSLDQCSGSWIPSQGTPLWKKPHWKQRRIDNTDISWFEIIQVITQLLIVQAVVAEIQYTFYNSRFRVVDNLF